MTGEWSQVLFSVPSTFYVIYLQLAILLTPETQVTVLLLALRDLILYTCGFKLWYSV
jgi:hypothetical protein